MLTDTKQNFDDVFNEIKNTEDNNIEKLNSLKMNLKDQVKKMRNEYNKKRETDIIKIDKNFEAKYEEQKGTILQMSAKQRSDIQKELKALKSKYSKNKSKAVDYLIEQFFK